MNTQDNKKRSRNIILRILAIIKQYGLLKPVCLLTLTLLFTPIVSNLQAQNDNLFQHTERGSIDLTERQSELLNIVESLPFSKEIHFVYLNFSESIKHRSAIRLNLPGGRNLNVQKRAVYEREELPYTWSGKLDEGYASIMMTESNGNVTGRIQTLDFHYSIRPLGDGLHALYEIDHSKAPPDHLEIESEEFSGYKMQQRENRKSIKNKPVNTEIFNREIQQSSFSTSSEIDLLVLYTPAAKNSVLNIHDVISGAVNDLEESFAQTNSMSAKVNVVQTYEVNFQETAIGDLTVDLGKLQDPNSGYMDEIHDIRLNHGANLVSLIVAPPVQSDCGRGFQKADYEKGFSIVRLDCIEPYFSFAHEIGHNIGADHNRVGTSVINVDFCDDDPPINCYGHGYNADQIETSTMMAYKAGYMRVNYWSTPSVYLGNPDQKKMLDTDLVPIGTSSYENNRRVWNERFNIVASLAPPTPDPLSAGIMGLPLFNPGETGFWSANVNGGASPYSYTWQRSYSSSSGPWSQVGTSSSYSQTVNQQMWLRLTVSDSGSQSDSDIMQINVTSCTTPPCPIPKVVDNPLPEAFALTQNYPNPFNPATTISYDLPEQADVRMEVYNMLGQRVALLVDGQVQAGSHTAVFDASNLSSGTYLLRMDAQGSSGTRFNRTMGMQLVK